MNDEFLTKKELAKELKCSEKTIDRLRKEGLPAYNPTGKILFDRKEIFEWIKKNKKA